MVGAHHGGSTTPACVPCVRGAVHVLAEPAHLQRVLEDEGETSSPLSPASILATANSLAARNNMEFSEVEVGAGGGRCSSGGHSPLREEGGRGSAARGSRGAHTVTSEHSDQQTQ